MFRGYLFSGVVAVRARYIHVDVVFFWDACAYMCACGKMIYLENFVGHFFKLVAGISLIGKIILFGLHVIILMMLRSSLKIKFTIKNNRTFENFSF